MADADLIIEGQIAIDRGNRNADQPRNVGALEAGQVVHVDDLALARVESFELGQRGQ